MDILSPSPPLRRYHYLFNPSIASHFCTKSTTTVSEVDNCLRNQKLLAGLFCSSEKYLQTALPICNACSLQNPLCRDWSLPGIRSSEVTTATFMKLYTCSMGAFNQKSVALCAWLHVERDTNMLGLAQQYASLCVCSATSPSLDYRPHSRTSIWNNNNNPSYKIRHPHRTVLTPQ